MAIDSLPRAEASDKWLDLEEKVAALERRADLLESNYGALLRHTSDENRRLAADRAYTLVKEPNGSQSSRQLQDNAYGPSRLTIHDHFDGRENCLECGGPCTLTGDDIAVTELVHQALFAIAFAGRVTIPVLIERALNKLGVSAEDAFTRAHKECRVFRFGREQDPK